MHVRRVSCSERSADANSANHAWGEDGNWYHGQVTSRPIENAGVSPISERARSLCNVHVKTQESGVGSNFQIREVMLEKLLVFFNQFRQISDIILILET